MNNEVPAQGRGVNARHNLGTEWRKGKRDTCCE